MPLPPKKIVELIRRNAQKTDYYKTLTKRNFRHYSNYSDYKTIMADLANAFLNTDTPTHVCGIKKMFDIAYMD